MFTKKRIAFVLGLALAGPAVIAACNAISGVTGSTSGSFDPSTVTWDNSDGVKGALRAIDNSLPTKQIHFLLAQAPNPLPPNMSRCLPFGSPGGVPFVGWPILAERVYRPLKSSPPNGPSEYDWIASVGPDNDICLGLRVPNEPNFPNQFTQVEFSLRSCGSHAYGHIPGNDFLYSPAVPPFSQADFPSNDPNPNARSLINLNGGDVSILVQGIDFVGAPGTTSAYMNTLGPTGWVLFMRDNGYRSGRFYNITGSQKGAPRAFADTPSLADDGFFESVQVNGDFFDFYSEPLGNLNPGLVSFCAGIPSIGKVYSFMDRSNQSEIDPAFPVGPGTGPGQGGGLLIIRREAFAGSQVVSNPNTPGPAPAPVAAGDLFGPPPSGYDSTTINVIDPAFRFPNTPGPAGVHEIGWSIFFIHGS